MGPEVSLLCSQEPATVPNESNPHPHILFNLEPILVLSSHLHLAFLLNGRITSGETKRSKRNLTYLNSAFLTSSRMLHVRLSHPPWSDCPNKSWWSLQMHFSAASCYALLPPSFRSCSLFSIIVLWLTLPFSKFRIIIRDLFNKSNYYMILYRD
jgi:hypothetical protein